MSNQTIVPVGKAGCGWPSYIISSQIWQDRRRRRFWHATLRLRSAIRPHHLPQRAVLRQICCFGERKVVLFQILLDGAEPRDVGTTWCLLQSTGGGTNRILLASVLSSMRIICPNMESWRNWTIAVSLGCFVSLRTSSFRTNWYHLMPSSIRRYHWSSASSLHASVFVRRNMREHWSIEAFQQIWVDWHLYMAYWVCQFLHQ